MIGGNKFIASFDAWTDRFTEFVAAKRKVEPGRYRAFGYEAPSHARADLRLRWREWRISMGIPRSGSSPEAQQELGLNEDVTFHRKKGRRKASGQVSKSGSASKATRTHTGRFADDLRARRRGHV